MVEEPTPSLVFITGCPRSGTTWLLDIFKQHPTCLTSVESAIFDCLREPWWITHQAPDDGMGKPRPGGLKKAFYDRLERVLLHHPPAWFPEWRRTLLLYFSSRPAFLWNHAHLFPARTVWSRLRSRLVPYPRLVAHIAAVEAGANGLDHEDKVALVTAAIFRDFLARHPATPGRVLVEKTPSHLFHADFLLRHFPAAKLIVAVRDPRDVCVSMDAYKRWMPQDRAYQVWEWNRYAEEGLRLAAEPAYGGRILTVRYEDLHADPPALIARMLAFAGLEASPARVEEVARATHISAVRKAGEGRHYRKGIVGDWRERLSPEELTFIQEKAGPACARLGYGW